MIKVVAGRVENALRRFDECSFHAALCDPPYGLSFMGKDWDHGVPSASTWAEIYRVLKPGAFVLSFGGTRTYHRLACAIEDAGFEIRDCLMWLYGQGFPKSLNLGNGYGTALKPAWEPIIVAMKPCEGTFAENARKHGVAGLAIDAARIPVDARPLIIPGGRSGEASQVYGGGLSSSRASGGLTATGRWPANVILDEAAAEELDRQSGVLTSGSKLPHHVHHVEGGVNAFGSGKGGGILRKVGHVENFPGDSGGASRFFYCAKASRKERGEGNNHPTVKPLKLCEYLARLILPPTKDARLLVPFSGSGSEILGARKAGWKHITGVEMTPEYVQIARKRLAKAA